MQKQGADWLERLGRGDDRAWADFYAVYDPVIASVTAWEAWRFTQDQRTEAGQRIRWHLTRVIGECPRDSSITWFIRKVCAGQCIQILREQQHPLAETLAPGTTEPDDAVLVPLLDRMREDGVHGEQAPGSQATGPAPAAPVNPRKLIGTLAILLVVPVLVVGALVLRDHLRNRPLRPVTAGVENDRVQWEGEPDVAFAAFQLQFRNGLDAALASRLEVMSEEPALRYRVRTGFGTTPDHRVQLDVLLFEGSAEEARREWTLLFTGQDEFEAKLEDFTGRMAREILEKPRPPPEAPVG